MKKILVRLLFLLLLFSSSEVMSQQKQFVARNAVGTYLPDDLWDALSLHGKNELVIADFWSTSCYTCLKAMPALQELQKQFAVRGFEIFFVDAWENKKEVYQKIAHHKALYPPESHAIYKNDRIAKELLKLFPIQSIACHMWFKKDVATGRGKVMAITFSDNTTQENITAVLSGREVQLETQEDMSDYNWHQKPFMQVATPKLADPVYYSFFGMHNSNVGRGGAGADDTTFEKFMNLNVVSLYRSAFFIPEKRHEILDWWPYRGRVVGVGLSEKEKQLFTTQEDDAGLFCYEVKAPSLTERRVLMQGDLNQYFGLMYGIEAHLDTMMTSTIVIAAKGYHGQLATSVKSESFDDGYDKKTGIYSYHYIHFDSMIRYLTRNFLDSLPIVDETGLHQGDRVDFTAPMSNPPTFEELKSALNRYGLDLLIEKRKQSVVIISPKLKKQ